MKKRRESVWWRWTIYIRQPASCREATCSLRKSAATSSSRPGLAIQVTASTTMGSSASVLVLRSAHRIKSLLKLGNEYCLLAVRSGRDDAHRRSRFLLHEFEVTLGLLRQPIVIVDAKRACLPAWQLRINRFDLFVA